MRRLTRPEFLRLPAGMFYFKDSQPALHIKGDTVSGVDWYVLDPAQVDGSLENVEWFDEKFAIENCMLETGASAPMSDTICRDGLFDADETFFVLEAADLARIRDMACAAIGLIEQGALPPPVGNVVTCAERRKVVAVCKPVGKPPTP